MPRLKISEICQGSSGLTGYITWQAHGSLPHTVIHMAFGRSPDDGVMPSFSVTALIKLIPSATTYLHHPSISRTRKHSYSFDIRTYQAIASVGISTNGSHDRLHSLKSVVKA